MSIVRLGSTLRTASRNTSDSSEWILTSSDVKEWRGRVANEKKEGTVYKDLLKHLTKNKLFIGEQTFKSGLMTVLHLACQFGSSSLAVFLISYKNCFDINELILFHPSTFRYFPRSDPSGMSSDDRALHQRETLVHAAVSSNNVEILKALVTNGSLVNIPNCCSKTPLTVAIEERKQSSVSFLLEHRASLNCQDNEGRTPLMHAARIPSMITFISQLTKLNADLSLTDHLGYTALHIAVAEGTPGSVNALISCGALDHLERSSDIPFPAYLIDRKNIEQADFEHVTQHHELFKIFSSLQYTTQKQIVDMSLLQGSFNFLAHIKHTNHKGLSTFLTSCIQSLSNALNKRAMFQLPPLITEPIEEYNGVSELKSIHDLDTINANPSPNQTFEIQLDLAYQALLIRERCLGYGDPTLIYSLFLIGQWLIHESTPNSHYKEGLSLWLRGSYMLCHQIQNRTSISVFLLNQILNGVQLVFLTQLEVWSTEYETREPRVILFGEHLCQKYLTPIINNLIKCVCLSIDLCKTRHTHIISRKSFYSGMKVLLEALDGFLALRPNGLDIEGLIELLIEKSPKIIIDTNGLPSTLVHIILKSDAIKHPENILQIIFEKNGHWMVNGVGPLGMRPLHLTYQTEVITLLLDYGAHLDAVDSSGRSAIKDVNMRRPDLFPDTWVKPEALKCLSACVIASSDVPYAGLSIIPPILKRFISLHDNKAQEAILRGELEFVFDTD